MSQSTHARWAPNWDQLSTQGLSLSIGWETGANRTVHVRSLPLDAQAGTDLCSAVGDAAKRLRDWSPVTYNPDMELDDATYAVIGRPQLATDTSIFGELEQVKPPEGSHDDLNRALLFYAVSVGPPGARIVFIRRYNPTSNLGRKWFGVFGDELSPVNDQLVALDLTRFDVVLVAGAGLLVFDLKQYERLFRDSPELLSRTPAKVDELSGQLMLTAATKEALTAAASSNGRIRTRLLAVLASGRLERVTSERLREAMQKFGLDPDAHLTSEGLAFEAAEAMSIMELLNEDLSIGPLTDTKYVISRKVPRG